MFLFSYGMVQETEQVYSATPNLQGSDNFRTQKMVQNFIGTTYLKRRTVYADEI